MKAMPSQRLTVWPFASFSTNESSRVFLVHCAISSRAVSQEISCQSVAARTADLRLGQPARVEHVLFERRALGAKRSAVGGMVGIAFHMDDLRRHVLGFIADGINKDAASDRAIRAGGPRFSGAGNL